MTIVRAAFFIIVIVFLGFSDVRGAELVPITTVPDNPANPVTPEKVELGKKLFFDRRLSGDGTMSCATCHNPEKGYTDGMAISLSYPTTKNWRNAPTLINVAFSRPLFWDGRARGLEEQALFPIMSAFEMNQNLDFLEEELKAVPEYVEAFRVVFGGEITRERIAMAIAAFERTIVSRNSPLDRYLMGDRDALNPIQKKGLDIFVGKGRCVLCHNGPNLTDNRFYNLGVPDNPVLKNDPRVMATMKFTAKISGYTAYNLLTEDPGRFLVTKDPRDWKAFRTPTLRDLALTGPYMHNGVFKDIEEVIDFFDRGGGDSPYKTELLKPLGLSREEKEALKAFLLDALQGETVPVSPPDLP